MATVKTLIVDDSVVYRTQIKAALSAIPWVEVIGSASNGKIAIERAQQAQTDLIILDMEMPELDGLQTLIELKAKGLSCKVLVFSSASKRGAEITFDALRLGASDFIAKPGSSDVDPTATANPSIRIRELLEPKILALFPFAKSVETSGVIASTENERFPKVLWDLFVPQVIVIGSSTGGPTALETMLAAVRAPLNCAILIAQHMPPIFTATLAERLQKISGITAAEGKHGALVEANRIYIAPGNFHMTISGTRDRATIALDQGPQQNSVRPAVDPLFESAANLFKDKCLGLVLTGMGADGKNGAEAIKRSGGAVAIQEEKSCVVFGMPGAVHAAGAFDKILSLAEMANFINEKAIGFSSTVKTKSS